MLVYLSALITNGRIRVALAGEQKLEQLLTAYAVVFSCGEPTGVTTLFDDLGAFRQGSENVRALQKASPNTFAESIKQGRRQKHNAKAQRDVR